MSGWVLVLNVGSSSLKYQVVDPAAGESVLSGHVERIDRAGLTAGLATVSSTLEAGGVRAEHLRAVGHRVVHGGARFTAPTPVDEGVLAELEALSPLAPLHNPPAVDGIRHAMAAWPGLPQVAVFDTAWFAGLPAAARTYALDHDLMTRHGIRRFGMHGLSHGYVSAEAARFLGREPHEVDLVVLHLGNGASASAVSRGRPLDTSMGLTPLEGLVMGTRAGDVDPGVLIHLLRHAGLDAEGLDDLLQHRSGLQGLAGVSDFRDLMAAVERGDDRAVLAYDVYCHRIRKYLGGYLAVLNGADAVVFTGGVGEHAARLRLDVLRGLGPLGIELDAGRNESPSTVTRWISAVGSPVAALVVPTHEELAIARQVATLLG
jgi:acetate kinase